jgi:hypothetical protein
VNQLEKDLHGLRAEAEHLGMPRSFVDDIKHLIGKLPMIYKAREKNNGNHS